MLAHLVTLLALAQVEGAAPPAREAVPAAPDAPPTSTSAAPMLAPGPDEPAFVRCNWFHAEDDHDEALVACQEAADDPRVAVEDRVSALGLLAVSHIAAGDARLAELAWLRMLTLDPGAEPLAELVDASPEARDVFARARARLERDGAVEVLSSWEMSGADRVDVTIELQDPFGRVASLLLLVKSHGLLEEARLTRVPSSPGRASFSGAVLTPPGVNTRWKVQILSATDTPIPVRARLAGARLLGPASDGPQEQEPGHDVTAPRPAVSMSAPEAGVLGRDDAWRLVGFGSVITVAGAATAAVWASPLLFDREPCGSGAPDAQCFKPCVFFDRYCGDARGSYLTDSGWWITGGMLVGLVGASLLGAGSSLLLSEPAPQSAEQPNLAQEPAPRP